MAISVSTLVWKNYPSGGSGLLALLSLADWADEQGQCSIGKLESIGGLPYLASLVQNTPTSANAKTYARIVHKHSLSRRLLAVAETIKSDLINAGAEVDEVITRADAAMVQLIGSGTSDPVPLSEAMIEVIDEIDLRANGQLPSGLQTGLAGFDKVTMGLEPGQLVIVAARPAVGKTALGLNIADHVSKCGKKTVAFFSLEMTKRELTQRILALRTGVAVTSQRSGLLEEVQWTKISDCLGGAGGERLYIIDRPAIKVPYIRASGHG